MGHIQKNLGVILKKGLHSLSYEKVQFCESYSRKVQIFESYSKRFNSMSHVKKKGSITMSHVGKKGSIPWVTWKNGSVLWVMFFFFFKKKKAQFFELAKLSFYNLIDIFRKSILRVVFQKSSILWDISKRKFKSSSHLWKEGSILGV